ncbi:MAG: S8 family serine peptidase [Candidatus Lokiarchaeota archaeon]
MKKKRDSVQDLDNILKSNSGSNKYIFYFNKTFFPQEVLDDFTSYGGIIDKVWNNKFNSVSGFSGRINNTDDLTSFIMNYPNLNIENDERIFTQMNYAGLQAGIFNKSWFQNGLKGVKNGSTAILDTGISDDNPYFPSGYSPNDFTGNIIAWNDYILGKSDPYDDNGHGTLISSIIGGTGSYTYNSSKPIKLNIYGNYSHSELFGNDYLITQNYTFKVSSFNISKANSILNINITWSLLSKGINKFGILLFKNNTLLSSNYSSTPDALITLKHNISSSGTGIYDIFIGYEHERLTNPIFNFTINLKFYPEFYIENYSYFTGVSNASKLVVYKVLNQSGIGYTSTLIEAFADIIENKLKYHILSVCLSLGSNGEKSEAVNKLIDEIIAEGIMVIIAAGNNGIKGSDPLNSLALNENAIVVGAINDKDQLTSYSSMGKELKNGIIKPDLVAPGGCSNPSHREIISADSKSNETITSYGTSISAAIVTGVYNLLVQSKWENWSNWMLQDTSKAVKMIKASLLMTASETNQNREDDYLTNTINEGLAKYSPSRSLLPLTNGLKDFHEGYGRINFQAAVDALNKQLFVNSTTQASLVSSLDNPLKNHVFARQINLTKNTQYRFNISYDENNANLEMFLFSQNYRTNGEPVLLQASRRITGNDNQFYFIPRKNETNCIIVIKAIDGETKFNLSINTVVNKFSPEMGIPEIRYANSQKNSTVISFREFDGQNPPENNTFDIYRFYIEYFDNDSSNIPPQEVYLSIIGKPRNYSMTQTNPIDRNFTDGVIFQSEYINLYKNQTYQYFFTGSDGDFIFTTNYFNLTVIYPSNERDFPYYHSFNDGLDNWTLTGTGWDILHQNNTYDNKSGVVGEVWDALYFGTYHNFPKNYTYQPIIYGEDPFPNGSLISPIFDLRKISNFTIPILEFGLRISVNSGDFVYFQVNPNGTGWITLKTYSNMEREWFLEKINLTDYKGNYVQFRFNTSLDENFDPINYKGILIDCFNLFNYSNNNKPLAIDYTDLNQSIFNLENFHFSVEYYDLDNNYPEYIFLEIGNHNYSMVNIKGDWNSNDGIEFVKTLVLNKLSNLSFRFYFSDGKYKNKTEIINEDNKNY